MTIADTGSWTIGSIVGVIFLVLLAVALLGLLVFGFLEIRFDGDPLPVFGLALLPAALVALILSPAALYPYKAEYHQWREVSGVVAEIDTRLVGGGDGGMEEKFVVRFDGSPQEFRVDDTRAALVEEGDDLTITCRRDWEYAATDGYVCRWIGSEAAA